MKKTKTKMELSQEHRDKIKAEQEAALSEVNPYFYLLTPTPQPKENHHGQN